MISDFIQTLIFSFHFGLMRFYLHILFHVIASTLRSRREEKNSYAFLMTYINSTETKKQTSNYSLEHPNISKNAKNKKKRLFRVNSPAPLHFISAIH